MTRTQWLRARQQSLQATDMVTLLGLGYDRQTAQTIYDEKVAPEPIDRPASIVMRTGNYLEPLAAELFTEATGIALGFTKPGEIHRSNCDPWVGCTLDYTVADFSAGLECKAYWSQPGPEFGPIGSGWVNARLRVQTAWQCLATGFSQMYAAVLFAPWRFGWWLIPRDDALCEKLLMIGADFWLRVQHRQGVDGWHHPLADEVLALAKRIEPGRVVQLGQSDLIRANNLEMWQERRRESETPIKELKAKLYEAMGPAEFGDLPDGSRLRRSLTRDQITRSGKRVADKPRYELPDMSAAESLDAWLMLEGESIEKAIEAIGAEK